MTDERDYAAIFSDESGPSEPLGKTASPWARFWARRLDLLIWSHMVGFISGIALTIAYPPFFELPIFQGTLGMYAYGLLLLPFAFVADAICMAMFGNTPGKLLVGIRVARTGGGKLTLGEALRRNLGVYVAGCGLGVPIVNLITFIMAYRKVSDGKQAGWDKSLGTRVVEKGADGGRTVIAAALVFALNILNRFLVG